MATKQTLLAALDAKASLQLAGALRDRASALIEDAAMFDRQGLAEVSRDARDTAAMLQRLADDIDCGPIFITRQD